MGRDRRSRRCRHRRRGLSIAGATSDRPSGIVTIEPLRILDTRSDVGLDGPFISPVGRTLQVTGPITTTGGGATVVPEGATGVVLNVTAVEPEADGFLSVRPAGLTGTPTTSNLNFTAGSIVPNAVVVALSPAGAIEITYDAFSVPGPTAQVLVDVTGYLLEMDAVEVAGPQGEPGAAGPPGAPGQDGAPGADGAAGADAPRPANIVWVALDGGDFTSVQDALDSIADASTENPYVVKVAPGTYHGRVVLKDHVDIEGSGRDTTILTAPGGQGGADPTSTVYSFGDVRAEVRHLTIANTGGDVSVSTGILVDLSDGLRLRDLRVTATGATDINTAVSNFESSPLMVDIDALAVGEPTNRNTAISNLAGSSPMMVDVVAEASSGAGDHDNYGIRNIDSSPMVIGGSASAIGPADLNYGVRNTNSSPVLDQVTVTSTGAVSSNPGISSVGAGASPTIRNSVVNGSSASVATLTGASTQVVDTQLIGPVSGANLGCLNSYDGDFTPLQANCQP